MTEPQPATLLNRQCDRHPDITKDIEDLQRMVTGDNGVYARLETGNLKFAEIDEKFRGITRMGKFITGAISTLIIVIIGCWGYASGISDKLGSHCTNDAAEFQKMKTHLDEHPIRIAERSAQAERVRQLEIKITAIDGIKEDIVEMKQGQQEIKRMLERMGGRQ